MRKIILCYIPAIHRGYTDFLEKNEGEIFVFGEEIVNKLSEKSGYYGRDFRAVNPKKIGDALKAIFPKRSIVIAGFEDLKKINEQSFEVICPREDITEDIIKEYLPNAHIIFKNMFLRWDRLISQKELEVPAHRVISEEDFDKEVIIEAQKEAEYSSDWWRQVGAVIVKDGEILMQSHNKHMPREDAPYVNGDPRGSFDAGERIDLCTAIHAEADLIAQAAKKGVSLEGASIYVTTFPCPNCARLIAQSGIKKVYYQDGYSLLDAETILTDAGAEIILVKKETA